jgi:GntR family transcriptional regulator
MDVKKGDYLLFVKSTAYDENGEPMYAGIQLINGDRFSLYVYESGK